jgi:hypothetical protein
MNSPKIQLPLGGNFEITFGVPIETSGPHRFIEINGRSGYHPTSLKTVLKITTDVHFGDQGSIVLWVCPLESLGIASPMKHVLAKDPNAQEYGLIGDTFPVNDIPNSVFCWYWRSVMHPQMIAKFKKGIAAGGAADYSITPYVPVEHLPLHEREWYQLVLTWDKPESSLRVYVNGILCATTSYPFKADQPKRDLYLGNTAMVFSGLELHDRVLSATDIQRGYETSSAPANEHINEDLRQLFTVQPKPRVDWSPDAAWALRFDKTLTGKDDFAGWEQQGCLEEPYRIRALEFTPEGLLIQTPDEVHVESRVYFWSPQIFEGDLAVEYEFRPEQDTGLALLVVQASGMQREDFLTDHPKRTTGAMGTIIADRVKNYHWEYFRKSVDVRCDLGTNVIMKNPWWRPMQLTTTPPLKVGAWHKLLFVQEGGHLRGAIDGEWVIDVIDDPYINNGPVLNSGRIGLRMMYASRLRFRNLKVWNRPHFTTLSASAQNS